MLDLPKFISQHVTGRTESLFRADMDRFEPMLNDRVEGRSILVIGGAGTIGTSFIKAVLRFRPARLFVVDSNENALTELVRDLRSSMNFQIPSIFLTYPLDFGDKVFEKLVGQEGPFEIVANFAAHKHVRSEKDPFAIEAMLANNVFKTRQLLELLSTQKPERFFGVSTDKAANPVNVMGASKSLMEQIMLSYAPDMTITTARFANVAFSNGSLPAGFLERLAKRQPIAAPLDVERYFVSPDESGQLCLLACMLGESGDIFFPKLDARHDLRTFSNISNALLETLGFQPDICASEQEAREKAMHLNANSKTWPVYYFHSDTSGEKLQEEFFSGHELLDEQRFSSIGVVKHHRGLVEKRQMVTAQGLDELRALLAKPNLGKDEIIRMLTHLVPGFQHLETGKGLDSKM